MYRKNETDIKQVTDKYGDSFCSAPFTSLHTGPDGRVSFCCKSRMSIGNEKDKSLEEIYNSPQAKSIRKTFLNNKRPKQCIDCWTIEDASNDISNNRYFEIDKSFDVIDKIIKNTLPDGTLLKQNPTWLDLLWTNKCNFACLGCSPDLSSTIATKYKDEYAIINGSSPENYFSQYNNRTKWQNDNSKKIDYILKYKDSLKFIHFNGGEPLLQEDIFELLDILLKNNLHKKIFLWFHTNGSVWSYKNVDLIDDYLVHWKDNCSITMSSDNIGEKGSYCRWGYNEKKWTTLYKRFRENNIHVNIQTCYSIFNCLNLIDIAEWYLDTLPDPVWGTLGLWTNHTFDPRLIQLNTELLNDSINIIDDLLKTNKYPRAWDSGLISHKQYIQQKYKGIEEISINFIQGIEAIDEARGTNFIKTFPELGKLYETVTK